jgi:hypothetical protein
LTARLKGVYRGGVRGLDSFSPLSFSLSFSFPKLAMERLEHEEVLRAVLHRGEAFKLSSDVLRCHKRKK